MPADDAHRLERARVLFRQNRWSMAADVLRDHLAAEPHDGVARSMHACALLYDTPSRLGPARDEANEGVRLAPQNAYCLWVRAIVAVRTDIRKPAGAPSAHAAPDVGLRLQHARSLADLALAVDPDYLPALHLLARIADDMRDYAAMLALAERSLRIDANDADSLTYRARAILCQQRWAEGLKAVNAGLLVEPESAPLHHLAGWALLEMGDRRTALVALRESLRLDPSDDGAQTTYRRATGQAVGETSWTGAIVCVLAYLAIMLSFVALPTDLAVGCAVGLSLIVFTAAIVLVVRDRIVARHARRAFARPVGGP